MIVDLHCHILPEMDDGSNSVEMSVAMLCRMAEQGIDFVCATSHYYAEENTIQTFCARRNAAMEQLQAVLPEEMPCILLAAEVAFFSGISDCLELDKLCIEGTQTLLLEMPFQRWTQQEVDEITSLVLDRRYQVVLVHPERFCFVDANLELLSRLTTLPIGLQINASTLLHWRSRKDGLDLLQMAYAPLLGSDCHNLTTRPPNLLRGREIVRKKLGDAFLKKMDRSAETMVQKVRLTG